MCQSSNTKKLTVLSFSQVLIDESTQATEPECLIPLVLGVKQVTGENFVHTGFYCIISCSVLSQ